MKTRFYIGRTLGSSPEEVKIAASDLTTHGLCFGMTGSGKTGLCLTLLEEASRANIPVIAIDPKGDLANLALSWPDFDPERFTEWLEPTVGEADGPSPETLGERLAAEWRDGLEADGIGGDDIRHYRQNTTIQVFTPGSTAGLPVSVLDRFTPPRAFTTLAGEEKSELIQGSVEALLGLVGIDADPIRSREAILVATILSHAWENGVSLTLSEIILQIGAPPFSQLGVFTLDEFFPEKDRRKLAMKLNGLVASPSFAHWLTGEPLDVDTLLSREAGHTRTSIFSIAHLDDSERMAFVTLLLERVLAWVRGQPGSTSLRALLFFDEVFGYLPPHPRNPSSKRPLLTLMKQARAFGLGTVLATQNPVDVDYKAITNAGTWFVGRLQTDQDRARIIDGLVTASSAKGQSLDRAEIEKTIGGLSTRQFLMQDIHRDGLVSMRTRFAISYLRGPMTRRELARLKEANCYNLGKVPAPTPRIAPADSLPPSPQKTAPEASPTAPKLEVVRPTPTPPKLEVVRPTPTPPKLEVIRPTPTPPKLEVIRPTREPNGPRFLDSVYVSRDALRSHAWQVTYGFSGVPRASEGPLTYRPGIAVRAKMALVGMKAGRQTVDVDRVVWPLPDASHLVEWELAPPFTDMIDELQARPEPGAIFEPCPRWLLDRTRVALLKTRFVEALEPKGPMAMPYCPSLDTYGTVGEGLNVFRSRLGLKLKRAAENLIGKQDTEYGHQEQVFDRRLNEFKELLAMDQRELKHLADTGADEATVRRVKDTVRVRMEEYKTLKANRTKVLRDVEKARADIEFSMMDKLADCALVAVDGELDEDQISFFGVVWIPDC